jgi:hypothetical protein
VRNRLDEIVEEELRIGVLHSPTVRRIAERAFRHGVERAQQQPPHPSLIQPAPAKEELMCWCSSSSPHPAHVDLRSRQRRKPDTCCSTSPCGRRTGKDRRR